MKSRLSVALFCATVISLIPALAQQGISTPKNAQAPQGQPNVVELDKRMAQVEENIQKMQQQMERVRQTGNQRERESLLQEHWAALQSTMEMMNGMWGRGMIGSQERSDYDFQLSPEQRKQRQYMNDRYIGLQKMMTDQMMQHQQWMNQPSGRAAPAREVSADTGKRLYESVCIACHGAGFAGAPRFGDKAAWAPRIRQGQATLYEHALGGFGMMPPRGGSSASEDEVKAAVDYMTAAGK